MANNEAAERAPLIVRNVAPIRQRRPRRGVPRRFCKIAFCSTFIACIIAALVVVPMRLIQGRHWRFENPFPHHGRHSNSGPVAYHALQELLLTSPDEEKLSDWSRYYTSGAHLAGKNYSQAQWTMEKWESFGVQSSIVAYDVYLNYPIGHRLALLEKGLNKTGVDHNMADWGVKFEATLEEDVLEEDWTTSSPNRIPTFHGYSASGNVTARYVYVNYGTFQDFEDLIAANVSLKGYIAIARYGGIFRGLKIKRAQDLGMIGMLIFSDPGDDGDVTDEMGFKTYPNGPARNPSAVQRGSAQFLSLAPGDPTTPGYPSKPGCERKPVEGSIPSIPSLPISYKEVIPILQSLNGYGPSAADFNKYWTTNLGLTYKGVSYNVGPSPKHLVLNLVNEQDYVTTPQWDVIGIINGTLNDEVIVVGNHRDAWILGGALSFPSITHSETWLISLQGDPNSGSAALMEVVRAFGKAVALGWKPLRTIVFASWDGEEYGLIGSTEWVEEYLPWLSGNAVAYVNMDVGCVGPHLGISSSPMLVHNLQEVASLIQSPNQTIKGQTVYDLWSKQVSTIGSGSDFTAFQDFAGIPSIDMSFGRGPENPVYQYHSNYDSYYWMATYGDPGWHYHAAAAKILGLFTAKLAETPLIPLNATDYATALIEYLSKVSQKVDGKFTETDVDDARYRPTILTTRGSHSAFSKALKELDSLAHEFKSVAERFDANSARLTKEAGGEIPWWKLITKLRLYFNIRRSNGKIKMLERHFLRKEGLDGRPWFKHVVYAPGLWTGYAGAVFPGLVESIDAKDYENAKRWVDIIEKLMMEAKESLE